MITKIDKNNDRKIRHKRVRRKISGTSSVPRLAVFRSNAHIYAQIIDDVAGKTLCAASTVEKDIITATGEMTKSEQAKYVGGEVAKRALALGVEEIVFDRGGHVYIGRVEALADGAREAGLKF